MHAFVTGGSGFVGRRLLERLSERGDSVAALARSDTAVRTVEHASATPVRGDLMDVDEMAEGMADCEVVFHLAAKVDEWGHPETFERINVQGTENALAAARRAGVDRFVHASTEGVLADGSPLRTVDETRPIPDTVVGLYPTTKAAAERHVQRAANSELETVIVRLPSVWGPGDNNILPELEAAVEAGRFVWFDGGRYPISTCHVENAVEGFLCAAAEGRSGEAYFVTDGDPVEFRTFVTELLATRSVEPPDRSIPKWLAWWFAAAAETAWRYLPLSGTPPLTRVVVATLGHETTYDDGKARRELGYEPRISWEEGLAALRAGTNRPTLGGSRGRQ